jgi:hypothetical protein
MMEPEKIILPSKTLSVWIFGNLRPRTTVNHQKSVEVIHKLFEDETGLKIDINDFIRELIFVGYKINLYPADGTHAGNFAVLMRYNYSEYFPVTQERRQP